MLTSWGKLKRLQPYAKDCKQLRNAESGETVFLSKGN